MAACHDEPAAVWKCACSPALSFCGRCLLQHTQEPGVHSVSHNGPPGQLLCGVCMRTTDHAISCSYPVCLCRYCVENLAGEEVKEVARGGQASLHSRLTQKRNDIRQHLCRALENLNNFEDAIVQASALEQELTLCKDRLRAAEDALERQNAEVQRLQAEALRRDITDQGQISGIIERIEAASRENERLKSDNQSLIERVQSLEKQLVDQHSLSDQVRSLSSEVASLKAELQETLRKTVEESAKLATEEIHESMRDQLQETACSAALKVADVIPLVAHLKVDSEWLNSDTAENLFQLAALGISSVLDSADMRVVARVSLLLAKLLGPCEEMTVFSKDILALIVKNSERGVNLLKNLEIVYLRAKGEETLKEVLKGVMKLVGYRECEDSLRVSARLSKVLNQRGLCEFVAAISKYLCRKEEALAAWISALLELPLDWADPQLTEQFTGALLKVIVESNFSKEHLALMKLLEVHRHADTSSTMTFTALIGNLLNRDSLKQHLHKYIMEAIAQAEFARGMAPAEGQGFYQLLCGTMKLFSEEVTAGEVQQLLLLLTKLNPRSRHSETLVELVRLFSRFKSEGKLRIFGFGALEWLFPNAQKRHNDAFAKLLFQKLQSASDFEETASTIGLMLNELSKAELSPDVEECFGSILSFGSELRKTVQLCLFLIRHEGLVRIWKALMAEGSQRTVIDNANALIEADLQESLLISLQVFDGMLSLGLLNAHSLAKEALFVLQSSVPEREPLTTLLRTVTGLLKANPPSRLATKCLNVWMNGKSLKFKAIYPFCQHVLERLGSSNTEQMLDDVIAASTQKNISLKVISLLLELYRTDDTKPSTLSYQLTQLIKLQGTEALSPLLAKLKSRYMKPSHRTLFICSVLNLCVQGNLQDTSRAMDSLIDIPETTQLLEVLSQVQESSIAMSSLDSAKQGPSTAAAIVQLASLLLELKAQGKRVGSISPNVKELLLQRTPEISELLPRVIALLQSRVNGMGELCLKVLGVLELRGAETMMALKFVCDLMQELMNSAQASAVLGLANVVLGEDGAHMDTVRSLQKNWPLLKDKLIALLNRAQDRVALQDISLVLEHTEMKELVNVQSEFIRFFDFTQIQWKPPIHLSKTVLCDSQYSTYTILDDGTVFFCGGAS